jgi:hypothetical protein
VVADGLLGDLEHADAFHRLAVPVKYLSTVSLFRPMASNSWAPQ